MRIFLLGPSKVSRSPRVAAGRLLRREASSKACTSHSATSGALTRPNRIVTPCAPRVRLHNAGDRVDLVLYQELCWNLHVRASKPQQDVLSERGTLACSRKSMLPRPILKANRPSDCKVFLSLAPAGSSRRDHHPGPVLPRSTGQSTNIGRPATRHAPCPAWQSAASNCQPFCEASGMSRQGDINHRSV